MICRLLAISVAATTGLTATLTFAQAVPPAQPTSFDYNYYAQDTAPSPSDAPVVAPEAAASYSCDASCDAGCSSCDAAACCDSCSSCSSCCDCGCSLFGCCDLGDPYVLFDNECCPISVNGWAQFGVYSNEYGNPSNGALGFNDENNGFQMHQLWLSMSKGVDTGGCGWDWGFGVDYIFGVDGADTQAFGNFNGEGYDNGWNASSDYSSALPQLYAEVGYNDLTVKMGHFYTLVGYEVVQATGNFFFSHSYSQYYAEPFTHTGALATYSGAENVEFYGGYVFGWDTGFDDGGGQSMFLGGASATLTDNLTATWIVTAGDFGDGNGNLYMNSIVVAAQLTDNLEYIFQHDLGDQQGEGNAAEWYTINQYLLYTINDCWGAGARFEWFRDDDGTRVNTGTVGNYYGLTAGLNYKPHANVIVRPELRYDWADVEAGALPFDSGTEDEQLSGGFDIIFTF